MKRKITYRKAVDILDLLTIIGSFIASLFFLLLFGLSVFVAAQGLYIGFICIIPSLFWSVFFIIITIRTIMRYSYE